MHCYPVYFRAYGPVVADDFKMLSHISGRMLIQISEDERTEVWTLNPTGVYTVGASPKEAVVSAVNELGRGLSVLAQDSRDYDEYEERSRRLVARPLPWLEERWRDACSAAAALPDRDEFIRLTETPDIGIVNGRVSVRSHQPAASLPMVVGDLELERKAA